MHNLHGPNYWKNLGKKILVGLAVAALLSLIFGGWGN